jgi:hypothetical protein
MAPLLVIGSFRGVTGGIEWAESYRQETKEKEEWRGKGKRGK